jgi:FMN phosphatase YigB (HAD superfamily)
MDVSALLFDMDDVLYDATVWRRWLLRLLGHLGLHTHYEAFFHIWERTYLSDVYRGQRDYWDAFRNFLSAVGLSTGQIDEVTAASHARRRELDHGVRAYPGVKATLSRLSAAGLPLGILCNSSCSSRELQQRLTLLGLGVQFRFVLSSRDLQLVMPQPETYAEALRRFSLPAALVAYVGHDTIELSGAANAGIPTIAFNQGPDVESETQIEQFEELLNLTDAPHRTRLAAS